MSDLAIVYGAWEQSWPLHIPPRSYLYSLPPVGLGSARVESLTSYLARLAAAHDISPGVLLTRELLPKVREEFRRHDYQDVGRIENTFLYEAHTLNGAGQRSQDWVNVLEQLTGVRGLRCLTMGTWRQVISDAGLLRRKRAWCPLCLNDWRRSDRAVHEPLLWALNEVSACAIHRALLIDRCPDCGRDQHFISAKVNPGYCCRCRCWLGLNPAAADRSSDLAARVAIAESLGELVSIASTLSLQPDRETLLHNLQFCIEELADGSMSRFAAATGLSFDIMADLALPERKVRLSPLCRVCTLVGVSPRLFICSRLTEDNLDCEQGRKAVLEKTSQTKPRRSMHHLQPALEKAARAADGRSLRDVAQELGYTSIQALRRRAPVICDRICPKRQRREVDPSARPTERSFPSNAAIEKAINAALLLPAPPPLKAIARKLGFRSDSSLYKRFPGLCKTFAEKNARARHAEVERCRDEVMAAADQTPPPTLKGVAAQIGVRVGTLQYRYPDVCDKIIARATERKAFLLERQRRELEAALTRDAVPSAEALAELIGVNTRYLREIHPNLHALYRKQTDEARRLAASTRRATFEAEVRLAVIEVTAQGLYPSRRRVYAAIANPSMNSPKILSRQIAATLLERKLAPGDSSPGSLDHQPGSLG